MEPKKHSSRDGLSVADVNDTPEDVYMDSFWKMVMTVS